MGWVWSWKRSKGQNTTHQQSTGWEMLKMLQDVNRYRRKARKRQKPNEARWKKEQTKDLLKAAEDARDKIRMARGGSGAHTETLLCSYRFNVFVLQKFFFLFYSSGELNRSVLFYQNIHVLNVCGYTPNDFVVQKHEYIQPSTPFIQYPHPPYKKEKEK